MWGPGDARVGPGGRRLGRRRPRRACTTPDSSDGSKGTAGSGPGALLHAGGLVHGDCWLIEGDKGFVWLAICTTGLELKFCFVFSEVR